MHFSFNHYFKETYLLFLLYYWHYKFAINILNTNHLTLIIALLHISQRKYVYPMNIIYKNFSLLSYILYILLHINIQIHCTYIKKENIIYLEKKLNQHFVTKNFLDVQVRIFKDFCIYRFMCKLYKCPCYTLSSYPLTISIIKAL